LRLAYLILLGLLLVLIISPWFLLHSTGLPTGYLVLRALEYYAVILILVCCLAVTEWLRSRAHRARKPGEEEWLSSVLSEVEKPARIRRLSIRVVDEASPRAFLLLDDIAVSRGLLRALSREEVKAVIAHELGHKHLTVLRVLRGVLAFAVLFNASITVVLLTKIQAHLEVLSVAVFTASIILGVIVIISLSRLEEHLADIYAVKITGSTLLASALRKLVEVQTSASSRRVLRPLVVDGVAYPSIENRVSVITEYYRELSRSRNSLEPR